MAWKVELDGAAERDLDKLNPQTAKRILATLHGRVAVLEVHRPVRTYGARRVSGVDRAPVVAERPGQGWVPLDSAVVVHGDSTDGARALERPAIDGHGRRHGAPVVHRAVDGQSGAVELAATGEVHIPVHRRR